MRFKVIANSLWADGYEVARFTYNYPSIDDAVKDEVKRLLCKDDQKRDFHRRAGEEN